MFLEAILDVPVLGWLVDNFLWIWLFLKLATFAVEQTKAKWDDKLVRLLKDLLKYLLPGKTPFLKTLDEEGLDEEESKSKEVEKEIRKQIRNL